MASVYLAYDPSFRRSVAIKLVSVNLKENPVFRERFEREAQLIARIEHPAIVPVYDFGEQDNQPYLVMRYMPGGALAQKIKDGPLHLGYASQIISQIAPALDAVHSQGIIHRDLKPANILLDAFGNPAISDFGIAHFTLATTDLTGSAIIGTPSYMSPEQVRGDNDLDGRSDIYALGVMLFEMLTGSGPFRAPTPLSVAMKHLTEPIPSILSNRPDLPIEVDHILTQAMAKDRELRYVSASQLALELRGVSDAFKDDGKPILALLKTSPDEGIRTEIDTGETPDFPLPPSSSLQPHSLHAVPEASRPAKPVKRSLMPQIAGISGVGLCLLILCASVGLFGAWKGLGLAGLFPGQNQTVDPTLTFSVSENSQDIVLYSDDFSNPSSGWPTIQNTRGKYSYQPDGYHIVVDEIDGVLWAKTSTEFDNSSIYVDTKPLQQSKNGYFGLLCRIRDDRNFYYFVIRNNGEYTIGKYENAGFQSLLPGGWKQNQAIRSGAQTNRIRADCTSDTLRLYVNNVLLDEVTDTDFSSGFSGILAASLDSQGFEVVFNEFLITEPDQ
jgi:serine/threonine-protein kinase